MTEQTEGVREAEAAALLVEIGQKHGPAALASSFSAEDMVLLDLIAREAPQIAVFTLDTGRLPEETLDLIQEARRRYRRDIRVFVPEPAALEAFVTAHGPNAFYDGTALRHECCAIRKVEPLRRALAGLHAWITGQRREHSAARRDLPLREWDAANGLLKLNPLAHWPEAEVWSYIRRHRVPTNALYQRGYASIGCAPCTRAVAAGEDSRAGRWWWENAGTRECGLHRRAS